MPSITMRRRPSFTPLTLALLPLLSAGLAPAQTPVAPPGPAASAAQADKPASRPAARPQPAPAKADPKAEQLERVEVSGGASESAQRRASSAS
ncbi:MAG: dihydrolipoyllysine acetyltransferase, partial [Methylibium sp.]|nr:dihydrolipoyllysine acetyltransferase [Methylibium sp.]